MLPPERRALLLLLTLAVAGQGVRILATRPGEPPGQVQILPSLSDGSPTAQRESTMQQARPLTAGERVDADLASPSELARLPRVGLVLAKVLVADRQAKGPFGSLEGLDRVPGIGPGLLRTLAPHLTFSGVRPPSPPGAGLGTAFAPPPLRNVTVARPGQSDTVLNVNRATAVELERLPGIGPSLARLIVADREARGPFATLDALDRIPGIGPGLVARLERLATAP
ncbi:MAG: competence protein ComEA [Gemmatimonadales bacterium]|jgi:competence ComEA-like helix-hairpin-helix protein|nr:competence protein ComEA [Gemmatimonadales bacterium]